MKNSKIIFIAIAIVILLGLVIFLNKGTSQTEGEDQQAGIEGDPIDSAIDFYEEWLRLTQNGESPYNEELINSEYLTNSLRDKLVAAQSDYEQKVSDPVLCRTELPGGLRSKLVSQTENTAQVLIVGPRSAADAIALVKLVGEDGIWKMNMIDCNAGETAPEVGEYNFDQEGYLLKQSVTPPLDPNSWYVVYESDGVMGFTAVLLFGENSTCLAADGSSIACGDESFYEAMKVEVKGNVNEAGVEVAQVLVLE